MMNKYIFLLVFMLCLALDSIGQGSIVPANQPNNALVKLSCINGAKIDVSACENCGVYDAYFTCALRVQRGNRFRMVKKPFDVQVRGRFVTVSSPVSGNYEKFSIADTGMSLSDLESFLTSCSCSDNTPAPEYTYSSYNYLRGADTCYVTDYMRSSTLVFSDTVCVPVASVASEERICLNDSINAFIVYENVVQSPLCLGLPEDEHPIGYTSFAVNSVELITPGDTIWVTDGAGDVIYDGSLSILYELWDAGSDIDGGTLDDSDLKNNPGFCITDIVGGDVNVSVSYVFGAFNGSDSETSMETIALISPLSLSNPTIEEVRAWADTSLTLAQRNNGTVISYSVPADGEDYNCDNADFIWLLNDSLQVTEIRSSSNIIANVLFVAANGDNATAEIGNIHKPWRDPWSAKAVSTTGQLIIVFPGTYTCSLTSGSGLFKSNVTDDLSLWKAGIRYYLHPNVNITDLRTGGTDALFLANVAGECSIDGYGNLDSRNLFNTTHVSSVTKCVCNSVRSNSILAAVYDASLFTLDAKEMRWGTSTQRVMRLGRDTGTPLQNVQVKVRFEVVVNNVPGSAVFGIFTPINVNNAILDLSVDNFTNSNILAYVFKVTDSYVSIKGGNANNTISAIGDALDGGSTLLNPVCNTSAQGIIMFGFSATYFTQNNVFNIELTNIKTRINAIQFGRSGGWYTTNDQINIKLVNVESLSTAGCPLVIINSVVYATGSKSYVKINIQGRQNLGNAIYLTGDAVVPNVYFEISGRIVTATGYTGVRINSPAAIQSNIILNDLTIFSRDGVTAGIQGAVANTNLTNYSSRTNVTPTNITTVINPVLVDSNIQ